jgi:hypothetical protein
MWELEGEWRSVYAVSTQRHPLTTGTSGAGLTCIFSKYKRSVRYMWLECLNLNHPELGITPVVCEDDNELSG